MTIRSLDAVLAPRSVALIGASSRDGAVGRVVIDNVVAGGFAGAIYPVNPKYRELLGRRCYGRMADLPEAPDIAVIMTPAATVPQLIDEVGERGTRVAVVLSAGFGPATPLRQALGEAAGRHQVRIIGPNTIGLLAPRASLNASFTHIAPLRGRLGLISQSGAMVSSMIDWAWAEGIGFSQIFSVGDMADVDIADCIDLLAEDDETDGILIYAESITNARKFMSAARAATRVKPVIAVKPGRHAEAAKAAATHTGALAGADRVIDAALRRAGIIRVNDLEELFEAAEVTARYRPLDRARIAIVTNGGGAGVLAVDQLLDRGVELAALAPQTLAALDKALPATWSHANPVDIIGDAPPERYVAALTAVAGDHGVDAVLVMNCPTALADPVAAATAVAGGVSRGQVSGKPVLACWLGKHAAEPAREVLQRAGIGCFDTPEQAAEGAALLSRWSRLRKQLERVPPQETAPRIERARIAEIIGAAAAENRRLLTEAEAKSVLAGYGVPVPETLVARSEAEVEDQAARLLTGYHAVVVKMLSKIVTHKSDVGGVALDLITPSDARRAAAAIRERFAKAYPDLALDGFSVQPMIDRPKAEELLAGASVDPVFGPVVVFGAGGTSVEVVDDTVTGLAPLDAVLAGDMVQRTRVAKLLAGYRDRPPADRGAITRTLVALSQLVIDNPAIVAIDVNPLLADGLGVIALDARIEIDPDQVGIAPPNPRLSIRPYPTGHDARVTTGDRSLTIRPIRPEDAALYPRFLDRTTPEDLRMRFLVATRVLSERTLIRLTQLDYDREMAFVAIDDASGELLGIVRYSADPDRTRAEYGVLVRSDCQHMGLGSALMRRLIEYAGGEGIGELFGTVLRENREMLTLCDELGFVREEISGDASIVRVVLPLTKAAAA
jgi:acetyltransferase